MTNLIEVDELTRYYGDHCAVDRVTFSLKKGEILGFLGPNGAGKSTTMQMICGNLAPSSGAIRVNGVDMLEDPKSAKHALGYLPEQPPVYRELTVDEYLAYCARLHGIQGASTKWAIAQSKERSGLTEVGSRLIGNLSKGYQQRVGIAQAIIHLPEVIILDEPTVGLDPLQIREIRELIRELGKEHGIILSTHILSEVQESCTWVQIINQGRLVLNDSIEGLRTQMRSSTLVLRTSRSADVGSFESIAGINRIEDLGQGRYRIFHEQSANPAPQLAERVVEKGWGLEELTPEGRSMEQVFIDITRATSGVGEKSA